MMIVLTAEEADKVRGRSPRDAGCALDPVQLMDGRYMLPPEVLDDPAHDDVRGFLAILPRAPLEKLPVVGIDDRIERANVLEVAAFPVRKSHEDFRQPPVEDTARLQK